MKCRGVSTLHLIGAFKRGNKPPVLLGGGKRAERQKDGELKASQKYRQRRNLHLQRECIAMHYEVNGGLNYEYKQKYKQ